MIHRRPARFPRSRRSLVSVALAATLLAPAAAAQGASTTLSVEQVPTRVAAWDGIVVWSRLDPATGTYSLVKSVGGGAPVPVGVAPRNAPFDIDLGTNSSGATYAVYTRDGDIYRLSLASGREARLATLSAPKLAERDPTIMRGEIAFIRRHGGRDELRIGTTTSAAKGSRLLLRRRSILSAELGLGHIAYVEFIRTGWGERHVHVRNIATGADRSVYTSRSGGLTLAEVTRPTFITDPAGFVWARAHTGEPGDDADRLIRYTLRGSKLTYAEGSPLYVSTAWAGPAFGVATASAFERICEDGKEQYCHIQLTGPLTFNPAS